MKNCPLTHNDLVNIVRSATDDVFITMLGITPERQVAYQDTTANLSTDGVVSLIGFAGLWVGTGSISCSVELACKLASILMMAEYDSVKDEVLDAAAEVTNMIIGNVKTSLEEHLGPMGLSIPTVIHGRNFTSRTVGTQDWTIVPCLLDGDLLEVQLCLASNEAGGRPRFALAGQTAVQI
ncbi:MAG: chemotaxis protein CheX [Bryobacteraceae bacterium]|nr:chemotaxis protein CheX [Bryobacteraceae bacterium]